MDGLIAGLKNCVAISVSLFAIVLTSCVVGTVLPFSMAAINVDAANAGPTIQVSNWEYTPPLAYRRTETGKIR
jgi:hypothetical protein